MEGGAGGFSTEVLDISRSGFKVRIVALSTQHIYSVIYNWMATDDDRVHVEYVDVRDMGVIAAGQGTERSHTINVSIVKWKHSGAPIVSSYLIGMQFEGGHTVGINQGVINSKEDSVDILLRSSGEAAIN
jgi:hypothetical protein